jgi:hypothetical protein
MSKRAEHTADAMVRFIKSHLDEHLTLAERFEALTKIARECERTRNDMVNEVSLACAEASAQVRRGQP